MKEGGGEDPTAPPGTEIKRREFHYSKLVLREKVDAVIRLDRGVGVGGVVKGNTHTQYIYTPTTSSADAPQYCANADLRT